ncbi:NADPH:quinone reductase-like Zn-dependent oxidoreductase [Nonomuraea thailandensis]|uniref:NADPH:quinone reductase-like Zn-dependent oxidoreductase n=1 Tax=Nonomuraea thailandensis TaxID=1188745 RepID=A0A9X2GD83_9ACTN|nr:NADP-dependent oxidoreductase [Nonomuraea thailandensis]MCP2353131.1 NADPH:quinone reductase-like Zn-dependent oxidoreductase [Nonomuraea thailandensis]
MTTWMRAVSQRVFGGPEVLELVQAHRPAPGRGEVLVRVHGAGVNASDCKVRAGKVPVFGDPPLTVGVDLAGVVEAVGDQVVQFTPGDKAYGMVFPPHGAYAEYVVASADALAIPPAGLDHIQSAALPLSALTAWQALVNMAALTAGQRVLIHAAAGGVGHLAVQIAKARGAYVIGTARAAKHPFLYRLGADELIDYTHTDFAAVVRDVDVVLDTVGGEYGPRSVDTLTPGGLLINVMGTTGSGNQRDLARARAAARGIRFTEFYVNPSRADLQDVSALVEGGKLQVDIQEVLPLEEAARAHVISETGRTQGKVVLRVSS